MASPLEIEILIHYFCCTDDFPKLDAPTIIQAIDKFVEMGLLIKTENDAGFKYQGNQKALKVYIDKLTAIPFPVQTWTIGEEYEKL